MIKESWTYLILDKSNGMYYVGKTNTLKTRWSRHLSLARGNPSYYIDRAIKAHGKENFQFIAYQKHESEVAAFSEETKLIAEMRNFGYSLYNLTDGGEGVSGFRFSDEQRQKRSESAKNRWKDPKVKEEHAQRMREYHKQHPMSNEARQKRSESAKNQWKNPEIRAKNIEGLKRAQSNPEVNKRRIETRRKTLENAPFRIISDEEHQKRSKSQKETQNRPEVAEKRNNGVKQRWFLKRSLRWFLKTDAVFTTT